MNSFFLLNLSGDRQHDEAPLHKETINMKFSNSDFHLMRWSLSAVCASILLSGVILYSSSRYADLTQKDRRAAQSQMNDVRNRLTMALQDQENLSVFSQEYDTLEKNKIIGDDHRLDWMEGLEKLRNQNLVISFRYNIAPQKIYAPQPAMDSGNFDIHYSGMKLQFDLLHEGQLLNFFDALRSQIKGRYQLEGCTMQRVASDEESATATGAHIKAECSGGWITLKNRNAQP
jgi:hypothetical protein